MESSPSSGEIADRITAQLALTPRNDQGSRVYLRTPEFGKLEGRTADPSAPLPRISCLPWWRWCTSCALLYGIAHTRSCPVQRGRKSGYASVGMTIHLGNYT